MSGRIPINIPQIKLVPMLIGILHLAVGNASFASNEPDSPKNCMQGIVHQCDRVTAVCFVLPSPMGIVGKATLQKGLSIVPFKELRGKVLNAPAAENGKGFTAQEKVEMLENLDSMYQLDHSIDSQVIIIDTNSFLSAKNANPNQNPIVVIQELVRLINSRFAPGKTADKHFDYQEWLYQKFEDAITAELELGVVKKAHDTHKPITIDTHLDLYVDPKVVIRIRVQYTLEDYDIHIENPALAWSPDILNANYRLGHHAISVVFHGKQNEFNTAIFAANLVQGTVNSYSNQE